MRELAVVVAIGLAGLLLASLVAFTPWYCALSGYAGVAVPTEPSPSASVPR